MVRMLSEIPGVSCPEPFGAFYAYPSVAGVLGKEIRGTRPKTSAELAGLLLAEAEVAVVPGEAFGPSGYLRLSYALGDDDLAEGIGRIAKLLGEATPLIQTMPRDLAALPKAHLHLHFTGSMRHSTLHDLARANRVRLPETLRDSRPLDLEATDERGWFRFQRLYDTARGVVQTESDVRRLLLEAAQDDAAEGSGWLELQVDPSTYARYLGGLTPTVELILDAAADAERATGIGIGIVIAANRTRHPMDARTLARLAARYADAGVVGFGLSNDERRGRAGTSSGPSTSPAGPGWPRCRTAVSWAGRLRCGTACAACGRIGSGTASARWRTRHWSRNWPTRGWPWRCARPRTWRWGWPPTKRPSP